MRFVAETNDKIGDAVSRVAFHNMPQDWLASYFHHGFWQSGGFLGDPGSEPAGKYHSLHQSLFLR